MSLGINYSIIKPIVPNPRKSTLKTLETKKICQIRYPDGSLYEGSMSNKLPNGYGTLKFESGNIYRGCFVNGIRDGYGEFYYAQTGEQYKGFWKNDMKEGRGEYLFRDGSVFKGIFCKDFKHGYGEKIGSNMSYSGQYVNGQKHGVFRFRKRSTGEIKIMTYEFNQVVQRKENSKTKNNGKILKKVIKKNKKFISNKKQKIRKKTKELKILNTHSGNPLTKNKKMKIIKSNSPPKYRYSRIKHSTILSTIKEVPETDCSVLSEKSEHQFLLFANGFSGDLKSKQEIGYENLYKLKSGVNLLDEKEINPNLFQFKTENEFENFYLNKQISFSKYVENDSTIGTASC